MAFMLAPVAIEGLTAGVALALAGAAACTSLAQTTRTTYWSGPTIFSGGSSGGSGGSQRRPPKLPPHSKKAIMERVMSDMMAAYLAKRMLHRNGAGGPLVYDSRVAVDMRLKDKHEWCGHFKKGPPRNVRRKVKDEEPEEDLFHQGGLPQGSKAGLAYAADGTQWIVAWHAPLNSNPKIYVECGDEAPIDWSRIERELDASCSESDCDGAMARITSDGGDAAVAVLFFT